MIARLCGHGDCGSGDPLGVGNWRPLDVSANCSLNAPVIRSTPLEAATRNSGNHESVSFANPNCVSNGNNLIRSSLVLTAPNRVTLTVRRRRNRKMASVFGALLKGFVSLRGETRQSESERIERTRSLRAKVSLSDISKTIFGTLF